MRQAKKNQKSILRDLGDGLVLRQASKADTEALVAFNRKIHSPSGPEEENWVGLWTRDLMTRGHPTFKVEDFTVVEDTRTGAIVSSLNLISQTWSYGGINFLVGRPELVGTDPDYRRRGLIRAQFEVIHSWSAERGDQVQAITGIPFFYRQFGYEMALELGGGPIFYRNLVPKLKEGEREKFRIRQARPSDLPFLSELYAGAMSRYLVSCVRNEKVWRYELKGRSHITSKVLLVIEQNGEQIGYLGHEPRLWGATLDVSAYELKSGVSWLEVTPTVMRYLLAVGNEYVERDQKQLESFSLSLGSEHPVYQVLPSNPVHHQEPYAFYLRVTDIPGFLRHIGSVLERRLAESVLAGYSGECKLSFFRSGMRLQFEGGRLATVEPWIPGEGKSAAFPYLTFLQVLFGYRSLEELEKSYPDCRVHNDEARILLRMLFPKKPSSVWALG